MKINIQELLDKGYEEFCPTRLKGADRAFEKCVQAKNGDILYYIDVYMYHYWGTYFEVEVQLYQKGTHEPVCLRFLRDWALEDTEDYIQRIYEVGFEPNEKCKE